MNPIDNILNEAFNDDVCSTMLYDTLIGISSNYDFVNEVFNSSKYSSFCIDNLKNIANNYCFDHRKNFNKKRIDFVLKKLSIVPNNFLDFGFNDASITRYITHSLNLSKAQSFCIDILPKVDYSEFTVLEYSDSKNIPLNSNSVDFVTSMMVLHHVDDVHFYLSELNRVLNKNGILFVRETNIKTYSHYLFNQVMEYFYYLIFTDSEINISTLSHKTLMQWKQLFYQHGFKIIDDFSVEHWNHFTPHHFYLQKY